MLIRIAPNMSISEDSNWGNYNCCIVHQLLAHIDVNFSAALGITQFSTCHCLINHWEGDPMCSKAPDGHIIHLSAREDYWCQWIYQFAHEYCHHLINGTFTGEITGLMWFEETICELASIFHLHILSLQWESLINSQPHWGQVLRDYQNALLLKNPLLLSATQYPGFLRAWRQILEQQSYHRNYYNALAARIYPLFAQNYNLWKIILHFGDMRQWNSLSQLFEHLHQTEDESYSHSLRQLEEILLS